MTQMPSAAYAGQCAGGFQLVNETCLLEAKWQGGQTGAADLHTFHGNLERKAAWTRGLLISNCGFTETDCRHHYKHHSTSSAKWRMIYIMRNTNSNVRTAAKEASHERIVSAAARAIRRSGYDGTGVADIMKEAGLTHGAFYAHFPSREAMLAEAAGRACAESAAVVAEAVASVPAGQALASMLRSYLSREHLEQIEMGCPLAALGSETPRQGPEVRRVTTRHIKEMIDLVARQSADWGQPGAHERALVTVATMVGTLLLARVVDEPALSDSLCAATLKHLAPA
jgi:TetR/AcrR family transcriptional regulator, transcriptional repressor for nem operon